MWRSLERGSSPVDWCEGNYRISPVIAEFVNTVSNILFFLLPPLLMHLFRDYGRFVNPSIHLIWGLLIVVGICSAYFHATLSLAGQLLDELAILWLFLGAFAMFFPRRFFPAVLKNDRKRLSVCVSTFALLGTCFAIQHPSANAFALMTLGIPALIVLIQELKRVRCMRVYRLGVRCASLWVFSVFCWINDRMFCDAWSAISFPYLHAVWHIFIFLAAYTAAVLFAYFSVKDEKPEQTPVLRYWPRDDFELGIPYVAIRCYTTPGPTNNI